MSNETTGKLTELFPISKAQRRVLGVLIEKGFTTPEYYPLTLKALTTGCNQKSNRSPIVNFSEDLVEETADELRELGLVGIVHTEGGRAARFRHYMRHKFEITEPQLAAIGELMLRGRQQIGELRSRANRMSPIDSLETLREALRGLHQMKAIQSSGDLSRRGIEVDHCLYEARENIPAISSSGEAEDSSGPGSSIQSQSPSAPASAATPPPAAAAPPPPPSETSPTRPVSSGIDREQFQTLQRELQEFREQNRGLQSEMQELKDQFDSLRRDFDDLRTQLGG